MPGHTVVAFMLIANIGFGFHFSEKLGCSSAPLVTQAL